MKRSEVKDFIPLLQAWADGKTLQLRYKHGWDDIREPCEYLYFNHPVHDYRIKPEPREWYIYVDEHGLLKGCSNIDQAHKVYLYEKYSSMSILPIKVREVTE